MREATRPMAARREQPDDALLLGSRRFLPLFLVQALGAFNDNVFKTAFVTLLTYRLAAQLGMDAGVTTTIAGGVFILPFAMFAPVAGQIADRVDKASMMRVVKFMEIVLMVGAAVGYHLQDVYFLYAILFLMGAQSAFFSPIKYGVLPQYLVEHELIRGNGLIQAATFFAVLMGTIAGAQLILTEAGVLWVSIAVIGIAVVGFLASLFAPPAEPYGDAGFLETRWSRMWSHAGDLWRARRGAFAVVWALVMALVAIAWSVGTLSAASAPVWALILTASVAAFYALWPSIEDSIESGRAVTEAWRAILSISWFWMVGMAYLTLLPVFTKEVLGADEDVFTVLLAAFSIGVAIGSVLCGFIYRGEVKVGVAPWGAVGIALFSIDINVAVAAQPPASEFLLTPYDYFSSFVGWRVFIDFVGLAICAGVYLTPLNAVYQNAAPEEARGRVVACSNLIDSTFMALISGVILGLLSIGLGPHEILSLIGGTGLIAAFFVARRAPETRLGRAALKIWPTTPPDA